MPALGPAFHPFHGKPGDMCSSSVWYYHIRNTLGVALTVVAVGDAVVRVWVVVLFVDGFLVVQAGFLWVLCIPLQSGRVYDIYYKYDNYLHDEIHTCCTREDFPCILLVSSPLLSCYNFLQWSYYAYYPNYSPRYTHPHSASHFFLH
ncbi:hypothetical protein HanIR_Chr07g0306611 [Helianthus annuus]|nr:hypothetical protein HanIR_Chr07g0306611 [Helianthus annuus]